MHALAVSKNENSAEGRLPRSFSPAATWRRFVRYLSEQAVVLPIEDAVSDPFNPIIRLTNRALGVAAFLLQRPSKGRQAVMDLQEAALEHVAGALCAFLHAVPEVLVAVVVHVAAPSGGWQGDCSGEE